MKKAILAPILVVILVAVILGVRWFTSPLILWSGGHKCSLKITVKNTEGGLIQGATVDLMPYLMEQHKAKVPEEIFSEEMLHFKRRFISDEKGEGSLLGSFNAFGTRDAFFRRGSYYVFEDLVVSHPDYVEVSVPLANFLGDNQFSISRKEMEFTVFMKKKPKPGAASGGP
jgi:hypothetical protein